MIEYMYLAISAVVVLIAWQYFRRQSSIESLPGPWALPLLGNALQMDPRMPPVTLHKWYKMYGPVFRVYFPEGPVVVVAGYESIKEVLVTRGHDFAGRPLRYRDYLMCRNAGMYANQPGERFTAIRKLFYSFSKAYGSGMDHVESIANEIGKDLFASFRRTNGEAFDPLPTLKNATVKFTLLMMSGEYLEDTDPLVTLTRELGVTLMRGLGLKADGIILDQFPWLRVVGLSTYKDGVHVYNLMDQAWRILQERQKKDPNKETLTKLLHDHVEGVEPVGEVNPKLISLTLEDAKSVSNVINLAGGVTTASTLYGILKALLHFPEVQEKAYNQIAKVLSKNQQVTLQDRPSLPYISAILKEVERFFAIAPLAVPHRAVVDTQILGIPIPKDTRIVTSLWSMHHDEAFWRDPGNFRPERFLNEDGSMLSPDHERLRHVLGFGAGPRICPGEQIARTRLFLWTVDIVRMFKVLPPDSCSLGPCDPSDALFGSVTILSSYKLRLEPRETGIERG